MNQQQQTVIHLFALLGALLAAFPLQAQRALEAGIPDGTRLVLRTDSGFTEASFTRKGYLGASDPERVYHSYHRDSIYRTQGGYHGRPLHGRYVERHPNRGLRVLGRYRYGLREGKWRHWDESGTLRKVSHWRSGQETGRFAVYGPGGTEQQRGYLRDGKFDGPVITHHSGDSARAEKRRYHRGDEVVEGSKDWLLKARDWVRGVFL